MSGEIQSYRDLTAWQKGMDLASPGVAAHRRCGVEETRLRAQRPTPHAATPHDVPANIAEGKGRFGSASQAWGDEASRRRGSATPQRLTPRRLGVHHLSIARGSLHEMETQLLLAQRLGYIPGEQTTYLLALSDEVGRLVAGLIRSLRR